VTAKPAETPFAALFSYGFGLPTILLGAAICLPHSGGNCLGAALYLAGAALTVLFAVIALLRREAWKGWTVGCAVAALVPLALGFWLSR
jgi:hypothetical protein